jgi:hypothetical protein
MNTELIASLTGVGLRKASYTGTWTLAKANFDNGSLPSTASALRPLVLHHKIYQPMITELIASLTGIGLRRASYK